MKKQPSFSVFVASSQGQNAAIMADTHQRVPGEDLQQGDQVMSISKVFIQVCHMMLRLQGKQKQCHKDSRCRQKEIPQ